LKAPQGDPSDQTPTRFAKRAICFDCFYRKAKMWLSKLTAI